MRFLYPQGSAVYTAQQGSVNLEAAAAYHARHKPQALFVEQAGDTILERYEGAFGAQEPHALYSGTKSFWGTAAVAAQEAELLSLDEIVWRGASIRELLNLTAGVPFGGLGAAVPVYEKALASEQRQTPGTTFTYGGIPLQIFGAIFAQRLAPLGLTPHAFLQRHILEPAGVSIASWRKLKDGTQPLPTGAFLTAPQWARYGRWVRDNFRRFDACFHGSAANPRYGLGWWLAFPDSAPDVFYASGSGGQAMYVVPSQELTIVRFGNGGSYKHEAFLRALSS